MGGKKNYNPSLGKSLTNKKRIQWNRQTNSERHTKEDTTTGLKSVTEETSYDEFIATAALARKDFTAEKLNIKFVSLSTADEADLNRSDFTEDEKKLVVVPRRPAWNTEMTAEELDEAEKEAFLQWRRAMAQLQEKEGITPFERNIEVWRQLWRVVEKSDIVVQIVDARNPLLYRCEDLEAYVKEMGKRPVLLINKADFLTEKQREYWSEYLTTVKLPHAFYSAAAATLALNKSTATVNEPISEKEEKDEDVEDEEEDSDDEEEDENDEDGDDEETETGSEGQNENCKGDEVQVQHRVDIATATEAKVNEYSPSGTVILNREELIDFLRKFKKEDMKMLNVGLVGYPNVGKSSTINSIMASKKTSVSSTPGKTKHFQTLFLDDDILLCDCPGLVMPAHGGSKGAMVLGGILPIDQLTNYAPGMALLAEQIQRETLEAKYGITLPQEYNFEDVLSAYAYIRGFMTARGLPDSSRASRIILKDYVDGRLNYCHAPPNASVKDFQPTTVMTSRRIEARKATLALQELNDQAGSGAPIIKPTVRKANLEKLLDNQFFAPEITTAHIKGKQYIASGLSSTSNSTSTGLNDKPWRRHNNKNKKEKLRRVYRHLDVE